MKLMKLLKQNNERLIEMKRFLTSFCHFQCHFYDKSLEQNDYFSGTSG